MPLADGSLEPTRPAARIQTVAAGPSTGDLPRSTPEDMHGLRCRAGGASGRRARAPGRAWCEAEERLRRARISHRKVDVRDRLGRWAAGEDAGRRVRRPARDARDRAIRSWGRT